LFVCLGGEVPVTQHQPGHLALDQPITQEAFAALVGISQQAVGDLVKRAVLKPGESAGEWLLVYTARLREEAAGRSSDLVQERARLAKEQADAKAMENAQTRGELVHVGVMRRVFAAVGRRAAGILEGLPARLRREVGGLDGRALELIEAELVRVRNEIGTLQLSLEEIDGSLRDRESASVA
jgi:phage terminase Nu1 subunit (DNA packaging protein)